MNLNHLIAGAELRILSRKKAKREFLTKDGSDEAHFIFISNFLVEFIHEKVNSLRNVYAENCVHS